jgi:methanogenic corrinoid protein MtbC1
MSEAPCVTVQEAQYQRYQAALLAGDRSTCTGIVQTMLDEGVSLKDIYLHVFQRALYHVGELWESQRISVSVEHLATAITERLLSLVQGRLLASGGGHGKTILIACVKQEHHRIGARMIADYCELRGWRGYFSGANTSTTELLEMIKVRRPHLLGLSLGIYARLPDLLTTLDAVRQAYPDLPVVIGGQAFRWGNLDVLQSYAHVSYCASLEELEQKMELYER